METNTENIELTQKASEIQARIRSLCNFDGDNLENEMSALKLALLENPAACQLLMPEDIGMMVSNLQRIVSISAIMAAEDKKKPKKEKQKFTQEEMQKALDEEF